VADVYGCAETAGRDTGDATVNEFLREGGFYLGVAVGCMAMQILHTVGDWLDRWAKRMEAKWEKKEQP
jgi:uncharacterized metal-binding protein